MKKILIAGASSRSGKTVVACGLLAALKNRGLRVIAYKAGPDYIDTEFLRRSGNCQAYNLDTWLMPENRVLELFSTTSENHDFAVIEGTMGLFDGGENSTAKIAKLLKVPVVLVLNVRSMGESAAAIVRGFRDFDEDVKIVGVILNFVGSDYHEEIILSALKDVKVLGVLRRDETFMIPERHLGLVQDFEVDFEKVKLNLDEILKVSETDKIPVKKTPSTKKFPVKIAIARDEAFSFYYAESERMLEELGAEIVKFSPIRDELPIADGYIFGGGYPELFTTELSENLKILESLKKTSRPILAECGGMMYLCMVGILPFEFTMSERAVMGYRTALALNDNLLCDEGESIRCHEFHYGRINQSEDFTFKTTRRNGENPDFSGYSKGNILASWLHVNFYGNPKIAEHFLKLCHN